jgi:hypothetical protein
MKKRYWMAGILALAFSPGCFGQAVIRIRVVNVKTGRPVPEQTVTVSMLYDKPKRLQQNTAPRCVSRLTPMERHS